MSSAGHVFDMIQRMKANRELLKKKRSRHAKIKGMYEQQLASGDASSNPIDHLSPEELAIARRKVLEKLRQQRKRSLMKLVLIGAVLLSLATWLLAWVFGY